MKRLLMVITVVTMILSFTACGKEVDKTAVNETFDKVNKAFIEVDTMVKDNSDKVDKETMDIFKSISDSLNKCKKEIDGEDLTQDRADELVKLLNEMPPQIAEMKTSMDELIKIYKDEEAAAAESENTETSKLPEGVTEEQMATLTEVYNELVPLCEEATDLYDKNGWAADEVAAQEMVILLASLKSTDDVLKNPSKLSENNVKMDDFIKTVQQMAEIGMPQFIEKVKVPYSA